MYQALLLRRILQLLPSQLVEIAIDDEGTKMTNSEDTNGGEDDWSCQVAE